MPLVHKGSEVQRIAHPTSRPNYKFYLHKDKADLYVTYLSLRTCAVYLIAHFFLSAYILKW